MPELLVVAKIELLVEYDGPGDDAPLMERVRAESDAADAAARELIDDGYAGAVVLETEVQG